MVRPPRAARPCHSALVCMWAVLLGAISWASVGLGSERRLVSGNIDASAGERVYSVMFFLVLATCAWPVFLVIGVCKEKRGVVFSLGVSRGSVVGGLGGRVARVDRALRAESMGGGAASAYDQAAGATTTAWTCPSSRMTTSGRRSARKSSWRSSARPASWSSRPPTRTQWKRKDLRGSYCVWKGMPMVEFTRDIFCRSAEICQQWRPAL